jgi:2-polyprenyl-3-methyl-5-hydroxy-6-metoxy-1,4-benzoquinol methylase
MRTPQCRFCKSDLRVTFADLGMSPLSNSYLTPERAATMEPFYPLHAYVCSDCLLVQLEEFESPQTIFSDYAYFSSYSTSWLQHARDYVAMMTERFQLGARSRVVELASNDGYLLQYFREQGIDVLGVEPAANVARVAVDKGIPTEIAFFGVETARRLVAQQREADVLLGNNVLAHLPDINDFVEGMQILLAPHGIITMEFPHLLRLIEGNQFDTIYHEHFSYLSLITVERVFAAHGLRLFDVEELSTHGGSLRIFACHIDHDRPATDRVSALRAIEANRGLHDLSTYRMFDARVKETKRQLLAFLIEAKRAQKTIAAYGAPAKGNTLLNYCGVRKDFIDFTVDRSPHKQNRYLPGTHIPIRHPEELLRARPDYVLILPWNLRDEIMEQISFIRDWGGQFLVPIPELRIAA